jgi:transposase
MVYLLGFELDVECPLLELAGVAQDRHIRCPDCNHRHQWILGDGRRKCKRCCKKFTVRKMNRYRKISDAKLQQIVDMFWLQVPASKACEYLKLNVKTVEKYYRRLRVIITSKSDDELEVFEGEVEVDESYFGGRKKDSRGKRAGSKIPVFGLLKRGDKVKVIIPDTLTKEELQGYIRKYAKPDSIVYTDGFKSYHDLKLKGFKHRRINHSKHLVHGRNHINGIESFWSFAKHYLKVYRGGYKKNFYLFLKEMEFRFNNRNNKDISYYLFIKLKNWSTLLV